ncbi:hypothetical protein D3C80_214130 [compost metagenome]
MLFRRKNWPLPIIVEADHSHGGSRGFKRKIKPLGAGQGICTTSCRQFMFPSPVSCCNISVDKAVIRRIARTNGDAFAFRQQDDDPYLKHGSDLKGGGPEHIIERTGSCELLAEQIKILGHMRALACGGRLSLDAACQITRNEADKQEERKRHHAFGIGDG